MISRQHEQSSLEQINSMNDDRRKIGLGIDPETADVFFRYVDHADPYGDDTCPGEYSCIGRGWFACAQSSDVWIFYADLPHESAKRLRARIDAGEFDRDELSFADD